MEYAAVTSTAFIAGNICKTPFFHTQNDNTCGDTYVLLPLNNFHYEMKLQLFICIHSCSKMNVQLIFVKVCKLRILLVIFEIASFPLKSRLEISKNGLLKSGIPRRNINYLYFRKYYACVFFAQQTE